MRILVLCDRYPDSYHDGLLLRVLHLAKGLQDRHQLDLACYHEGEVADREDGLFRKIWSVPAPCRVKNSQLLGPFKGWGVADFYPRSPAFASLLNEKIDPQNYDVVWDAGAAMFPLLTARWAKTPVVADLVDDMVLTTERALRVTKGVLPRARLLKYLSLHYRFERYVMRRVAQCCVVSEEDAACFRRVSPHVPVSVVQNGVDLNYFTPAASPPVRGRLVFEGSMAFRPNQDAAIFFVHEIMPLIWAHQSDVTLTLVGRDPSSAILALAGDRVTVTGSVPDVRPYVHDAEIFVCPLLSGAGIKNKVLQAWAMAKPVIASSLSVGGLCARDGENVLIRDGAQDIADSIIQLLEDPIRRGDLGSSGRETVESHYTWRAQARAFEALLAKGSANHQARAELIDGDVHAHRG